MIATAISVLVLTPASSAASLSPNIVIIVADDLGWNDVGYHGSIVKTPQIDALANKGVMLERFYAQPTCSPTRASLMTGKSAGRLGIFAPLSKHTQTGLPTTETLMPEYFQRAGYQTFLVGKWHLGLRQREYLPNFRGFDHFYGHITGGVGYWDHVHGGAVDWQRNGETVFDPGYATHLEVNEAVSLLGSRDKQRPFLLVLSFNAPHLPNEAPPQAIAEYEEIESPHRRVHAAMVSELDRGVGRLLNALREEGILDETLIWFMSDNGGLDPSIYPEEIREEYAALVNKHGIPLPTKYAEFRRINVQEAGSDNSPLRSGKTSVYEGGTRVPSFLYWRGTLGVSRSYQMITVQDVLPTLIDASGVGGGTADSVFDGRSMWSAIANQEVLQAPPYITRGRDGDAVYRFPWKVVRLKSGKTECYDLIRDPTETHDVSAMNVQLVSELLDYLDSFPVGPSVHPSSSVLRTDPDFFGGEVDREPWTELVKE